MQQLLLLELLLLVSLIAGRVYGDNEEDECGIYPSCSQYGPGQWQILEDCHKYIECSIENGEMIQKNLECPDDLVFTNEYGKCVPWDMATQCKVFQETPCLFSCPRVLLQSTGSALTYQSRRIGCFRISGTMFGGTLVHYQNKNSQYLAPDSTATPLSIHWLVSESYGAFNGGIRNRKFDYIRCPFTGWNSGWQVDMGSGTWTEDTTMTLTCFMGDDTASSSTSPASSSTTSPATTTAESGSCHKDGCNEVGHCQKEFTCCTWNSGNSSWTKKTCTCNDDFLFSEDFGMCTVPDGCIRSGNGTLKLSADLTRADHTCDDGTPCTCF